MSRPPKPFLMLKNEKKSHRTKSELSKREKGEKALASGKALKERSEVNANPVAHKEFLRLNKLLINIEKNDAIYEPIINRYCMLQAECMNFEEKRENAYQQIYRLEEKFDKISINLEYLELKDFAKEISNLYKMAVAIDKQIQSKRKMLLDIEKENIMTIAAALRSIPKKEEKTSNELLKALNGG